MRSDRCRVRSRLPGKAGQTNPDRLKAHADLLYGALWIFMVNYPVMLAHHRRHLGQAEKVRAAWSAQSR